MELYRWRTPSGLSDYRIIKAALGLEFEWKGHDQGEHRWKRSPEIASLAAGQEILRLAERVKTLEAEREDDAELRSAMNAHALQAEERLGARIAELERDLDRADRAIKGEGERAFEAGHSEGWISGRAVAREG